MALRRTLAITLAASLVMAACGGGDTSSPRQRNSAVGLPCISDPEYTPIDGLDTVSVVVCDEADAVYYDGTYLEPDQVTRRVSLGYRYNLESDLTLNVTSVRFLSAARSSTAVRSVSQDTIDVYPTPCEDGGHCRLGEMIEGVGTVIARVSLNQVLVLAPVALNTRAMNDSYVVGNSLNEASGGEPSMMAVSYSAPSGVQTVDGSNTPVTLNGDFGGIESYDGVAYGRFGTPAMLGVRPFFYSPAGQLLLAYMRVNQEWYLPSRTELREAMSVLGSIDANPEGFDLAFDYLSSTVDTDTGLMWARSVREEKTVGDGATVRIRPVRLHVTSPVEATFNIQNTFREAPEVATTTTSTVVEEETTTTAATEDTTVSTESTDVTETTVVSDSTDNPAIEPDANQTEDSVPSRAPVTADELAISSVSARGTGLRRVVRVNFVAPIDSLWQRGYAVSLIAETPDSDQRIFADGAGSSLVLSAARFADSTEYRFFLRAFSPVDDSTVTGEWVSFTPNADPLDRTIDLQPPTDVNESTDFSTLNLFWSPSHSRTLPHDAFEYLVRYGKVGEEPVTITVQCCSTSWMRNQFEVGAEYEISVATALLGTATSSVFSDPIRLTPLPAVDSAERDRLVESCAVDPEVSFNPADGVSTRTKVTITVTHPCLGENNIDNTIVNLFVVEPTDDNGESWSSFGCAVKPSRVDVCTGRIEPGKMTLTTYMAADVAKIVSQVTYYFGPREGFEGSVLVRHRSLDIPTVVDAGRCSADDIRIVRDRLTVDCDLEFDGRVEIVDGRMSWESARTIRFTTGETVDLSMHGRGWQWMTVVLLAGMQTLDGDFLFCITECDTDLGSPAMPVTISDDSFAVDAQSLVAPACDSDWATDADEAIAQTASFSRVSNDLYRLDRSSISDVTAPVGELFTRQLVGDGGVDVIATMDDVCDPFKWKVRFAFIVSPMATERRVADATAESKTELDGLSLLASPDAPASLAVSSSATRVVLGANEGALQGLETASIRFDDGPWIPAPLLRIVGASIPKDASKISIRTTGVDGTRVVTRDVVRETAGGSVAASQTRPEVQVIEPTSEPSGGVPVWVWVWIWVLVALVVVVASSRRRRITSS